MKKLAFLLLLLTSFIYAQETRKILKSKYWIKTKHVSAYGSYNNTVGFLKEISDSTIVLTTPYYSFSYMINTTLNIKEIKTISVKNRALPKIVFATSTLVIAGATIGLVEAALPGAIEHINFVNVIIFGALLASIPTIISSASSKDKFVINYDVKSFNKIRHELLKYQIKYE